MMFDTVIVPLSVQMEAILLSLATERGLDVRYQCLAIAAGVDSGAWDAIIAVVEDAINA